MWKRVLTFNFTLTLFRDETIDIFKLAESAFDKVKVAKRIVRETEQQATLNAAGIHRERRRYLRGVLREGIVVKINKYRIYIRPYFTRPYFFSYIFYN